jgi:NAD(P)-dependent dehydrogenase (short-subunit alcohol dehydrogenase family)
MSGFPSPTKKWHTSSYPTIDPARPELSAKGKSVVITGGGSGIGLAISKAFALAGASQIAIIGRRAEVLAKAKASITDLIGSDKTNIFVVSADLSKKDQVDSAFTKIHSAFGGKPLDIFVNNAGYFSGDRPFGTETPEEWDSAIDINIKGLYLGVTAFIANAKADATVINISTAIAHIPAGFRSGFSSYAATKLAGSKIMEFVQAEHPSLFVVDVHPGQVWELIHNQ